MKFLNFEADSWRLKTILIAKAIGMKIIDSGPRPRGGRVAASKFHYLGQMPKKFIILEILPIFKHYVNFFSNNPIITLTLRHKMRDLTRSISICNQFIIHLIPVQTTAILNMFFEPEFDKLKNYSKIQSWKIQPWSR